MIPLGVVLVPLPGPGWPIVFLGFVVLGSEFERAERVKRFAQSRVTRVMRWSASAAWPVRAALRAATLGSLVIPAILVGRL